jgi:3-deoxy-D-manno-octulosonic-acid transferase
MKKMWFLFYNFFIIPLLFITLRIAGLFNEKVRRGIKGRKRIFEELILNAASLDKSKKLVWFHSSSLGEFEQAKPIIEELKKNKDINILVTFFSPSGYENSRKYPYADLISYIPFDTVSNARRFISIVQPALSILMRYDIWPNHVWATKDAAIPSFIVDATMKDNSPRTLPLIKSFHKNLFRDITRILTVSKTDADRFKEFGCSELQIKAVGDTRFDRVHQKGLKAKDQNILKKDLLHNKKILVAGSTWYEDEDVIFPAFLKLVKYYKDVILIVAPHEPSLEHLERIENNFSGKLDTIRFSYMNNYNKEKVIIVDSIGILLTLYSYADAAFVGGSFKQNVHNVLEAAVYGIPVLFGPKIETSQEAKELLKRGGGIMIKTKKEAYRQLRILTSNEELKNKKGSISYKYVEENLGATKKIMDEIYDLIYQ